MSGNLSSALICLGSNAFSNFGDVRDTVLKAMSLVAEIGVGPILKSALYQTPAFPAGSGPDFINAAVAIKTGKSPQDILDQLHQIETRAGRVRMQRWGPRALDLDLAAMNGQVRPDLKIYDYWRSLPLAEQKTQTPDQLILPHPRLQDRSFMLIPMRDVAPDWVHPVLQLTPQQMLALRPADERASVVRI